MIAEKDVVWAKHKNGRYYQAKVGEVKMDSRMCVFFPEDQSFSKDIRLSDIVDWEKIEKPVIGQRLQIRWVDGKVYDADCIGKFDFLVYTVSETFFCLYCLIFLKKFNKSCSKPKRLRFLDLKFI